MTVRFGDRQVDRRGRLAITGHPSMLESHLKNHFGFTSFKEGQREVVDRLLAGQSAVAIFPTGAGKSLCYQLPAMLLPGLTLVVSPLLALMKDQVEFLRAKGIPAARLDSTLDRQVFSQVVDDARQGRLKILMISVERFRNERFRVHLKRMRISLLVIDEAHCISEWGHNFRPEYLKLPAYRKEFAIGQTLLLTATATPPVVDEMCAKFAIDRAHVTQTGFYRPNLFLQITPAPEEEKEAMLLVRLSDYGRRPAIVYVTQQKTAERLAAYLSGQGLAASAYHAGLQNEEREEVQQRFMAGDIDCVAATIAFGMGIDKSDIRCVIHFDLPKSLESYSQEIGRAGRDGLSAEALLLFGWEDVPRVRALIDAGGNEERVAVEQHKLGAMVGFAQALNCRRRVLLGYLGEVTESDCGNCDVCLDPPELYDATEHAQKALSCVFRLGERFGVGHVVDVLRGSEKQRITDLRHDRLSTFGIGADLSADAWRSLLQQLVHLGYLRQEMGQYPVLKLTPAATPVLRGEETLMLARPRAKPAYAGEPRAKRRRSRVAGTGAVGDSGDAGDDALFEELRALRRQIAERERLPAYVIFHDATLRDMAAARPTTGVELLGISGVGARKLVKYGGEFLAVLRRWAEKDSGQEAAAATTAD